MALIVISGYPSSGKSTRSAQIKADFERRIAEGNGSVDGIKEVAIVNDVDYDGRNPYDSE
jgi:tRNA uridine 5-carbamoylmethylation protein Kti12